MFGNVVMDIPKTAFYEVFDAKKKKKKAKLDTDLDAKALKEVIEEYKKVVKKHAKREFPQDPHEQLVMARDAVFRRSEEHTSELQSPDHLVCRLLLEKKKNKKYKKKKNQHT